MSGGTGYMGADWIGDQTDPRNFGIGRNGYSVNLIVAHHTATNFANTVATFSTAPPVHSAHFIIGRVEGVDGFADLWQMVAVENTAYHAGDLVTNYRSIGVETVQTTDPNGNATEAILPCQYRTWQKLAAQIATDYGFTLAVGTTLRPHRDFTATSCPGDLDLNSILTGTQGDDMTPQESQLLTDTSTKVEFILEALQNGTFSTGGIPYLRTALDGLKADVAALTAHSDPAVAQAVARIEAALKSA